jgi:hypothetical protein
MSASPPTAWSNGAAKNPSWKHTATSPQTRPSPSQNYTESTISEANSRSKLEFLSDCETLQHCWDRFTDLEKQGLVDEIAGYIKQLRDLEPPDLHRVSSTEGNACRQIRVGTVKRFGPFDDAAGFHKLIRGNTDLEPSRQVFGEDVVQCHQRDYRIRFTHGDFGVSNILVRYDATVAAIIDWECAGWYPEYWEYTMAHYNHIYCMEFYAMLRERVETRYDEELKAERAMWRMLDQPLDEMRG